MGWMGEIDSAPDDDNRRKGHSDSCAWGHGLHSSRDKCGEGLEESDDADRPDRSGLRAVIRDSFSEPPHETAVHRLPLDQLFGLDMVSSCCRRFIACICWSDP